MICDSLDEIARLDAICASAGRRQRVLIRVTPGVKAEHALVRPDRPDSTPSLDSGLADGLAAGRRRRRPERRNRSTSSGCTRTSARRSSSSSPTCSAIEALAGLATPPGAGSQHRRRAWDRLYGADEPPSIAEYVERSRSRAIRRVFDRQFRGSSSSPDARWWATRGSRSIGRHGEGDPGGTHLRRRRRRHVRQPAPDALRLALSGRDRRPRRRARAVPWSTVAGMHCESSPTCSCATRSSLTPRTATSWPRPRPAPTATRWPTTTTRVPRPPVIICSDGDARLVVRRETYDDLTARDV